jgi:hypothetical protein
VALWVNDAIFPSIAATVHDLAAAGLLFLRALPWEGHAAHHRSVPLATSDRVQGALSIHVSRDSIPKLPKQLQSRLLVGAQDRSSSSPFADQPRQQRSRHALAISIGANRSRRRRTFVTLPVFCWWSGELRPDPSPLLTCIFLLPCPPEERGQQTCVHYAGDEPPDRHGAGESQWSDRRHATDSRSSCDTHP